MGFLQNHAIKKSCKGLAKELLNHVSNYIFELPESELFYISQLPEKAISSKLEDLFLAGLKNFVDNFQAYSDVDLDLKSIRYVEGLDFYLSILTKGVYADLSYDPHIGTDKHNKLIDDVGIKIYVTWKLGMERLLHGNLKWRHHFKEFTKT